MLPSMMSRETLTRKRFPRVNDHGTMVVDTTATPTTATFTGSAQPGAGLTDRINRDGAEVVYMIFAEPSADVEHYDVVTLYGTDYQVSRAPERWRTGILNHTVLYLSKWNG